MIVGIATFLGVVEISCNRIACGIGGGCVGGARWGAGALVGRGGVPVRDFLLPARLVGGGSGIKLSLRAESGPKSALWGVPGEFCTG